jgi:hypothetical protein
MNRGSVIIATASIITLAFVFYANGGVTGFAVWNAIPVLVAMITLLVDKARKGLKYAIYGFASTITLMVFVVHAGYVMSAGKTMSMPLLSGEKLYGLPVYAIAAGYAVGMIGVVIGAIRERNAGELSRGGS